MICLKFDHLREIAQLKGEIGHLTKTNQDLRDEIAKKEAELEKYTNYFLGSSGVVRDLVPYEAKTPAQLERDQNAKLSGARNMRDIQRIAEAAVNTGTRV